MRTDPAILEIIQNFYSAVCCGMGYVIERTSYSTFVTESADYATALTLPTGEFFAYPKTAGVTNFMGLSLTRVIKECKHFEEGDIILTNDPYTTDGLSTHLPDVHVIKPIFHEGELICFAWTFVHTSDVGGCVPSSITPTATDIQMEGLRIPPVKLFRAGKENQDIKALFLANSRMPVLNMGDLNAMVSAVNTAERKIHEIVAKFGLQTTKDSMLDLIDQSELRARKIVEAIPDGSYSFADYLDDDMESEVPIRLAVEVRVEGSDITLDFRDCDPQVATAFNLVTNGSHHSYIYQGLINYIISEDPFIPVNGGLTNPIHILAPEGTIVNAQYPAAVGCRHPVSLRLYNAVLGALAQVIPEKVQAAGGGQAAIVVLSVPDDERGGAYKSTVVEPMGGGGGGQKGMDGVHGIDHSSGFLCNTPIENLEHRTDILVKRYELVEDSAGAGLYRGGNAIQIEFEVKKQGSLVGARGQERLKFEPWGLQGGIAGEVGTVTLNPGTEQEENLSKISVLHVGKGDVVRICSPSGGGWGNPYERPEEAVLLDVEEGLLSVEKAEEAYGVILKKTAEGLAVDEEKTREARAGKTGQKAEVYDLGEKRRAYEAVWTPEASDRLAQLLQERPISQRSYYKHQIHQKLDGTDHALSAEEVEAEYRRQA